MANLIKTRPDIASRQKLKDNLPDLRAQYLMDNIKNMKEKGEATYFIHLKTAVKVNKNAERIGEKIKVHMPLPIECQQLKNIKILATNPVAKYIAPENFPQRTAYFEELLQEKKSFSWIFLWNHVKYNKLDPSKVSENQPNFETGELEPHIMFTPYIKELAEYIIKMKQILWLKQEKYTTI